MKQNLPKILFALGLLPVALSAQTITAFSDQTSTLLTYTTCHSGNAVGVCDMNNDFKDDIIRDSANKKMFLEFQNAPNAMFTNMRYVGSFGSPWGLCVGDYNNDGYNDVFQGSSTNAYLLTSNASTNFTYENVTLTYGGSSVFTQGCNFADINNDGSLDMFICHDTGMPKLYKGNGAFGGWIFDQTIMPLATSPASDNSGNYASIWTDVNNDGYIDCMITHCRQSVTNPLDARRIDQIFINNGNGTYTQDVTNWTNLRDGAQGWSTAWGDIDNDGDMDAFVLNYDVNSKLMINNGNGVFTDVMAASGIPTTTTYFGENATWSDFDNDGYLDLLITGDNHYLYRNNHNNTFTNISTPFPYSNNQIRGQGIGDLNGDGFLDVYATYANLYNSPSARNDKVWINTNSTNGNHWVKYNLIGGATPGMSNKNGIGAIVKIYGSWGEQVREVRSGEGYGLENSLSVYFGLGSATNIDSTTIIWPSGIVDHMLGLGADAGYTVNEGQSPLSTHSIAQNPLNIGVYPNPSADGNVSIHLNNFAQYGLNNLSLNVYDVNGKVVYSEAELKNSIINVNTSEFKTGMYFVQISKGDKRIAEEKMIVQ
ncbi:MAG: VCBS repeat-containing protein [Bacteroidetes bacterium]|nr:VCBS repeat-containing protein [Bacteroidota bacterium]